MKRTFLTLTLCLIAGFAQAKDVNIDSSIVATTSGTVAAGCKAIVFIYSSNFQGSIAGVSFYGTLTGNYGPDYSFTPPIQTGDKFGAISYVVTAGAVRIMQVR